MHPLFVTLFLEPETDDLLVREEEKRRYAKVALKPNQCGARGQHRIGLGPGWPARGPLPPGRTDDDDNHR
jgi:hypothetical protein